MATITEQYQARLTVVDELLATEYARANSIGHYKQTGDGPDRVTNQDLGSVYARIKNLEAERTTLQNQINRLGAAGRVQTRPISTVRFR